MELDVTFLLAQLGDLELTRRQQLHTIAALERKVAEQAAELAELRGESADREQE